jgi:predicted DsbA family dithiol-disulfide isomerase
MNPNLAKTSVRDDSGALATLHVDMIADLVCPWCWLGKRRLDDALLAVHGPSIVSWYPFQLNPQIPDAGIGFEEYLETRFGDARAVQPALAELTMAGKREGINFRFDRVARIPKTVEAHRVVKLAEAEGVGVSAVAENIFRGFFEEGLDISKRDALLELGKRSGLSARSINRALDDETSRQIVLSQEAQVRQSGVTGVPDFLINKRLFVIGAQSTEALVNVFDRAMFGEDSDQPVSPVVH